MASERVTVFEVGPRDGLQNEPRPVSTAMKIAFVRDLLRAGVKELELGSFVRADRVPQMADTEALFKAVKSGRLKLGRARAWSLVPNMRGLERAIAADARQIAIFIGASETFNRRNIGASIAESLKEYSQVVRQAHGHGIKTRAYVSTVYYCPYEGRISPARALKVIERLGALGVEQVSIGDTIGKATPKEVERVVGPALDALGVKRTAVHFHDTRGTALANTLRSLELGVRAIDSSAGGLGGCPFAPGATGNLATEDLVFMLEGMGMKTGIDLDKLCRASLAFARRLKRPITSRYLQAFENAR